MRLRILVADKSEAAFFDTDGPNEPLHSVARLKDSEARLRDRELDADRPGRTFDSMSPGRHAMNGERSTQSQHHTRFAHRIVEEIENAHHAHAFDRLVVMAEPQMLGLIRAALPETDGSFVAAEIPKNLVHHDVKAIRNHIPAEAFQRGIAMGRT